MTYATYSISSDMTNFAVSTQGLTGTYELKGKITLRPDAQGTASTVNINGRSYNVIYNEAQLRAMRFGLGTSYVLGSDIDLSSALYIPAGDGTNRFSGHFDGFGHVIMNMTINSGSQIGFFGATQSSVISHVDFDNASVVRKTGTAGTVGVVVSYANGTSIFDVAVTRSEAILDTSIGNGGGIVGSVDTSNSMLPNTMVQVSYSGSVLGHYTGGLAGNFYGTILQSFANVTVTEGVYYLAAAGGLVGQSSNVTIRDSYATGSLTTGLNRTALGGLVGYLASSLNVSNSFSLVDIQGKDASLIGGLIGTSNLNTLQPSTFTITNSFGVGSVSSEWAGCSKYLWGFAADRYTLSHHHKFAGFDSC
jgi:hypothetical protein